MSDTSDAIDAAALAPKKTNVDGEQYEEHAIGDLIDADQYLGEKLAGTKSSLPIRIARVRPGGTV